jgi:hypothetical protein
MNIQIEVKNHYGNTMYYPACDKSSLLARLAGTKTLTPEAIRTIKELGYNVQVKQPTIEV